MTLKLIVETECRGKDWWATCEEELAGEPAAAGPIGTSGPKRSEPAAASGAIGDYFRQRLALDAAQGEFEYQPAPREGGRKWAIEYRSSPLETWSSMPYRLASREAAEEKIAELIAEDKA